MIRTKKRSKDIERSCYKMAKNMNDIGITSKGPTRKLVGMVEMIALKYIIIQAHTRSKMEFNISEIRSNTGLNEIAVLRILKDLNSVTLIRRRAFQEDSVIIYFNYVKILEFLKRQMD